MDRSRKDKGSKKPTKTKKNTTDSKSAELKVFPVSSVKPAEWLSKSKTGSANVYLKEEKGKGRFCVAKRDIKEGELIIEDTPWLAVTTEDRKLSTCDYCFSFDKTDVSTELPFKCNECHQVYYCSEECQNKAKAEYHDLECTTYQRLVEALGKRIVKSKNEASLSRMMIRLLYRKETEPTEKDENKCYFDDYTNLWSNLKGLATKKKEVVKAVGKLVCIAYEDDYDFYKENDPDNVKFSLIKTILSWINPHLVADLACKEENNAFGLYFKHNELSLDESIESNTRMYAYGVYMSLSLFNHTCCPNIYKIRTGTAYRFSALHDIKEGQELNITYTDLDKNTNQRRTVLEDHYGFHCVCPRCETEDELSIDKQFRYLCGRWGCGGLLIRELDPKKEKRICNRCYYPEDDDD